MLTRLIKLQETRVQFANNQGELYKRFQTDFAFKKEVKELYEYFLKKTLSCGNCYDEAYLQLVKIDLTKAKEITKMSTLKFQLKAGVLLHDVNGDSKKMISNVNITDELALYHLKTNSKCRNKFVKLPDNIDELLKDKADDNPNGKIVKKGKGKKADDNPNGKGGDDENADTDTDTDTDKNSEQ